MQIYLMLVPFQRYKQIFFILFFGHYTTISSVIYFYPPILAITEKKRYLYHLNWNLSKLNAKTTLS